MVEFTLEPQSKPIKKGNLVYEIMENIPTTKTMAKKVEEDEA